MLFDLDDLRALGKRVGPVEEPAGRPDAVASVPCAEPEADSDLDIFGAGPARLSEELRLTDEPESPRCLIFARLREV